MKREPERAIILNYIIILSKWFSLAAQPTAIHAFNIYAHTTNTHVHTAHVCWLDAGWPTFEWSRELKTTLISPTFELNYLNNQLKK